MEFSILKNVKTTNKRENIYIPLHKKWIELSNIVSNKNGIYEYEIVKLEWRKEFENKNYIEENFDVLFKKPIPILYPKPERKEEVV